VALSNCGEKISGVRHGKIMIPESVVVTSERERG
jgi:hypothetical protein